MSFAESLSRLEAATKSRARGVPPADTVVRVRDLRELLHHFWRLDGDARAANNGPPFQKRIWQWMDQCFGSEISGDTVERHHRFVEESLELAQSCHATAAECHMLVDYVFGRPVGQKDQEVGGVMVTLSALCLAHQINMNMAAMTELTRISDPKVMETIRAKQATKPKSSPLPGAGQN